MRTLLKSREWSYLSLVGCGLLMVLAAASNSATTARAADELPLIAQETFDQGAARWEPSDPAAWKVIESEGGKVYSQFAKSKYNPPYRSPYNFSLLKDVQLGDFVLEARCRSTVKDYGHRDMCLFFGYQEPGKLYYVHLGKKADDHANQIFIVNNAARTKISTTTTAGTDWTDNWYRVKLVRKVADGSISVYFDQMDKPVMTATDKTFTWGRVGIGSFDDTGDWDDITIRGIVTKQP